jgi:cell wall-associated NlpC family hydrolase
MKDFSRYLTIPFKSRGRDFDGCDCWGLCRLFLKEELGIEADSFAEYGIENYEAVREFAETEKRNWLEVAIAFNVPVQDLVEVGDIVELKSGKEQWHIGIVAALGYILHIEKGSFPRLVCMNDPMIRHRISHVWRHRDL